MQVDRSAFYLPEDILREVQNKVDKAKDAGEAVDYLTFVPNGEPTLDANLGRAIELLSIMSVHPMRKDAVGEFLNRAGADWAVIRRLLEQEQRVETDFEGHPFYLRKLDHRREPER
jgi:hypothetical protein